MAEVMVSFLHLPAYLPDQDVLDKLRLWGVTPIQPIRRRFYPGTDVADGTRFVRVRFPKEVASLPYSTSFRTAEGPQYFRVIHDRQVKLCLLCMKPGHVMRDCPELICRECCAPGHFARNCTAARCPKCVRALISCVCLDESADESQDMDPHESGGEEEESSVLEKAGGLDVVGAMDEDGDKQLEETSVVALTAGDGLSMLVNDTEVRQNEEAVLEESAVQLSELDMVVSTDMTLGEVAEVDECLTGVSEVAVAHAGDEGRVDDLEGGGLVVVAQGTVGVVEVPGDVGRVLSTEKGGEGLGIRSIQQERRGRRRKKEGLPNITKVLERQRDRRDGGKKQKEGLPNLTKVLAMQMERREGKITVMPGIRDGPIRDSPESMSD